MLNPFTRRTPTILNLPSSCTGSQFQSFFCRVPLGPLKIKNRSKNGPSSCQLPHRLHYHSNLVVTVVWKPDISIIVCINESNYCSRSWQIIFLNRVSALVQFSYLESISHAEPHIIENIHPNSVRSRA